MLGYAPFLGQVRLATMGQGVSVTVPPVTQQQPQPQPQPQPPPVERVVAAPVPTVVAGPWYRTVWYEPAVYGFPVVPVLLGLGVITAIVAVTASRRR